MTQVLTNNKTNVPSELSTPSENTYPHIPQEPSSQLKEDKLYLVTHNQLSSGYQTAQTAHVIAEFYNQQPEAANRWHSLSNSLIVLEAKDAEQLYSLYEQAVEAGHTVTVFREPDLGDAITSIAFNPGQTVPAFLAQLPCAGRKLTNDEQWRANEAKQRKLTSTMMTCEQAPGQTILQHGRSVREHYFALVQHLKGNVNLHNYDNWVIPEWFDTYRKEILEALPSNYIMDRYLTLHDCGKPEVLTVDTETGRRSFPNHAEQSAETFKRTFNNIGTPETLEAIHYLILHDMDMPLLKADQVEDFLLQPYPVAKLVAALAETTSNAGMFGGIDSTSFKIKFKQLNQRGKAITASLFSQDKETN